MLDFYKNKRVFLTGHTGFKGAWLSKILINANAHLTGYSLPAPTEPSMFDDLSFKGEMHSIIGDVRDLSSLSKAFEESKPEIVLHLAAQPLVRESYNDPVYTYETNVMGTVNILECVRKSKTIKSFLNVTTDKVYRNNEWCWGYRETDILGGFDPYSNSKSCSELVTESYRNSFFQDKNIGISTARAGNVIGGGDFAADRIIPDCIRFAMKKEPIIVRNPHSIRPYQHVLEPLSAYLQIAARQYEDISLGGCYNIGPDEADCVSTGRLADIFCGAWGEGASWKNVFAGGPHEAAFLKLDCSKASSVFGIRPRWSIEDAVKATVDWSKAYMAKKNMDKFTDTQIKEYFEVNRNV